MNLLNLITSAVGSSIAEQAPAFLGESRSSVETATGKILPALLASLVHRSHSADGAAGLLNTVLGSGVNANVMGSLAGLFSGGDRTSALLSFGNGLVGNMFGSNSGALASAIGGLTGMKAGSATSLMGMLAPLVFGYLKNHVQSNNLNATGLQSLLQSQGQHLQGTLDEKVTGALSWGSPTSFLSGLGGKVAGTAAAAGGAAVAGIKSVGGSAAQAAQGGANAAAHAAAQGANAGKSWFSRWWWLIPLVLLAAWLLRSCADKKEASAPAAPAPAAASTPAPAPVAQSESKLDYKFVDGKAVVNATVSTEAEKAALLEQLKKTYGDNGFSADIKVDANTKAAGWLAKAGELFAALKMPGAGLSILGNSISLTGAAADPKLGLLDKLKGWFGDGFKFDLAGFDPAKAMADATSKVEGALAALKPGSTAEDVAKAFNLNGLHFATGSAVIQPKYEGLLKSAAQAIKAYAGGKKIEVAGHTDSQGQAASNKDLSQRRAESVRAYLVKAGVASDALSAAGFGDTKPIGDNASTEGRFQNRRIELAVK